MSNYLAIATVTAALQQLLQEGAEFDVPGALVTTVRPDKKQGTDLDKTCINVYLYQASPHPAWRNADLRTRRPKEDLTKQRQAGLDLHYLLTFYGNEQELIPQRLMGSAIRTLADRPILERDVLDRLIQRSQQVNASHPYLADSDLTDQEQVVRLLPGSVTTEELSRIWSVFFQTPYALALPYDASVVLIEGDRPGKRGLPIRRPPAIAPAAQLPVIDRVEFLPLPDSLCAKLMGLTNRADATSLSLAQLGNAIDRAGTLILKGKHLQAPDPQMETRVQLGSASLTPTLLDEERLHLDLSALSPEEVATLQAGTWGLKVLHQLPRARSNDIRRSVESNAIPLSLRPALLLEGQEVTVTNLEEGDRAGISAQGRSIYSGRVQLEVDVTTGKQQRAFLLLNGIDTPNAYVFPRQRPGSNTRVLSFALSEVAAGMYLVRVQIDGAESLLDIDESDRYSSPRLVVGEG